MPISAEFVTLCQAQISLLTEGFGATLSIVYLTQELVDGAQTPLVPIAAYPDLAHEGLRSQRLLAGTPDYFAEPPLPSANAPVPRSRAARQIRTEWVDESQFGDLRDYALTDQRQFVVPLIHDEMVLGLLVTRRDDPAWQAWEQAQIEDVAKTLAIACVLDQRYQWLDQERRPERLIQMQQHDQVDNLLHQFRNSLTALQTFGKLLLKRLLPGNPSHEVASNLLRETTRLQALAQQLEGATAAGSHSPPLALPAGQGDLPSLAHSLQAPQIIEARLETKSPPLLPAAGVLASAPLTLERCLIETILAPLISAAETIATEKGLTLCCTIPDDLPPVWANPQALYEVLNNLVENALKYTPSGGQVWVGVTTNEDESQVAIAVTDSGPGIPVADQAHLFERHFRGVQAEGTIPGSGLGLAIARSLTEQMHGKIQVFSPAQWQTPPKPGFSSTPKTGVGTTFQVELKTAVGEERIKDKG